MDSWHPSLTSNCLWMVLGQSRLLVTPDGESYAYSFFRRLDDLYLSSPLR